MLQIPKIQIRGNILFVFTIVIISILAIYSANSFSEVNAQRNTTVQQDIATKQTINLSSLSNHETSSKEKSDALTEEVNKKKKEEVTKFNKDIFATNLSIFAKANNLTLSKIQQEPVQNEQDGFYSVRYNVSLNGSMYGVMNFFNLLEGLGSQYSVDYFSFRQEGTYNWLLRETDGQDLLSWVGIANSIIDPNKLKEIIDINTRIETDDYDYGVSVSVPTVDSNANPLEDVLDDLFQQEVNPETKKQYESDKKEQEEKTKNAKAKKEADIKAVEEFLKQYYPEGTIIKNGQLIVSILDGNMVFDVAITFTGNITGAEPKSNINQYLISSEAITSDDRNVEIIWNGQVKNIPSIIKGVDITNLNGLVIKDNDKFVVSWNNNQLSKEVLETFLTEKLDGVNSELDKVAAEIRFFQQYNKEELDLKKYLIFLYMYQQDEASRLPFYSEIE